MRRDTLIVLVAYHGADRLKVSLDRLGAGFPTLVVDNSGSSAVEVAARSHGVEYVRPGGNLGFAGGVNVAARRVLTGAPRDVLLVNPDAEVSPECVERLSAFLQEPGHGRVAAVAPELLHADGTAQRVVWPFPTPLRAWLQALGIGRLPARSTFVIGAVVLLRWEALREVGLFDERFFLYAEEADWQKRARDSGWQSALCRDATAVHEGGGMSPDAARRELLFHAAHEIYIRKWYGRFGWAIFRSGTLAGAAVRALVLRGGRRAEATRRLALYARGPQKAAGLIAG